MRVSELDCVLGCRRLVEREAIFAAASSGAVGAALLTVASSLPAECRCALILPDGGAGYLDTIYDDDWVTDRLGCSVDVPFHQSPTRGDWLTQVLRAPLTAHDGSVADGLLARGLELRCEPGRALLDGCGLTAARVCFRKQRRDGTWLIGVEMNRTQCRSTSDDFLVDPLLIRPGGGEASDPDTRRTGPIEGYLVGAYCIERELLTWRRMRFADGVDVGDIVVFPNTAGYLMHILESSSHQIPLARNLLLGGEDCPRLDPIDRCNT